MADLEKLYAALEKADSAGETQDAQDIAAMIREQKAQPQESDIGLGAAARGAVRGALPALAGLVSGAAGATVGSAAGPVGTVAGGLGAGFAGSAAMSAAQEKFLEEHPDFATFLGQSPEQQAKDIKEHPYLAMAGELFPNILAFRPSGALLKSGRGLEESAAKQLAAEKAAAVGNAVINTGVGAGMEVGQQAMGEEPMDYGKVGIAALAGTLGQKETRLGRGLTNLGERIGTPAQRAAVAAFRRPEAIKPEEIIPEVSPEQAVKPDYAPSSASQDTETMLKSLEPGYEHPAFINEIKPEPKVEPTPKAKPISQVEPELISQVEPPITPKPVKAPEVVPAELPHPYHAELTQLYKDRNVLLKSTDNLNSFLRKVGINTKEKSDMGIESGNKSYPYVFREKAKGLDVLMHDAIEHGIITESDLARYPDPVEGFREMAKAAIDGDIAPTPKNMENLAKLEAVNSRIEHLESIPKEDYALHAETPEESKVRIEQEAAARKAQEDAAVQADMDAQAERDRQEIARRSQEQASNFELGQTPEESLTGQQRLAGQDDDIPFERQTANHTEKFAGDVNVLAKNIRESLNQMNLHKVGVTLADSLKARVAGKMESVNGAYIDSMIHMSLNGENIPRTMNHEALHAMRDHGFFTEKAWNTLSRKAQSEWMKKYDIEKDYGHLSKDLQHEEAIAKAFADYRTQPAQIKSIMVKAIELLKRIGNVLRGRGFKNAEDIFKSASEGKLRATKEPSAGPSYELKAPETPEFKRWFGNSKVVNEDGTPKVMYHGTVNFEGNVFKPSKKTNRAGNPDGYYFTSDPQDAAGYVHDLKYVADRLKNPEKYDKNEPIPYEEGAELIPVYLSIKNPFVKGSKVTPEMLRVYKEEVVKANSHLGERAKEYAEDKAEIMKEYANTGRNNAIQIFPNISFPTDAMQRVLKAGGYDGFQDGGSHWVAFDSNQIKSAFNKTPTENPDIRFEVSKNKPITAKNVLGDTVSSNWDVRPNTWIEENIIRRFQDKHVDLKRTVETIKNKFGEIAERFNPYEKDGLWHSKAANEFRQFDEKELDPLAKKIDGLKLTTKEVMEYLHNRHAEERNNQMNKINPDIVDELGNVHKYGLKDKGSGIHTDDARKYLKGLPEEKRKALENVAKDVYGIIKKTQDILVKTGQIKKEVVDAWNKTYKYYIPLLREMEEEFMTSSAGGRSMATKNVFQKRAMGSERNVADILNSVIRQREIAIENAAKMEVDHALYGLAIKSPNPDIWLPVSPKAIKNPEMLIRELDALGLDGKDIVGMMQERQTRELVKDKATGLDKVVYKTNPLERYKDNVLPIRINGEDSYIFFNKKNPVAANMVKAFRGMDTPTTGLVGQQIGKATQWLAKVNTQWNPVFGALNFMRDFGSAMANLSSTELKGQQAAVGSNVKSAFSTIWRTMRDERKGGGYPDTEMGKLYKEFRENGGQTLYREQLSRRAEQENVINEKINNLHSNIAKKMASDFFNGLSDFNDSIENAIRLSAYKTAKDNGLSITKAATLAKELTVNFDRKGAMGQQVNNYYAFFNASAQGTARMVQTLKGPAGKKIIMGGIGLGALQAGMMAMADFGEDDPPEFIKSRNFIIPTFDGSYIAIPYPLGLHFLPNIGRLAVETGMHGHPGKHFANMAAVVADAFNPLGGGELSLQTIAPTVLDPAVALATNKDAFGRPIYKEDRSTSPTTGLSRSREQSTAINKSVAEAINYITGGTEDTKGFLSPTADQLDYLTGQVTGGAGREVMKLAQTTKAIAEGDTENLPSYQIPLAGRFYGNVESPAANSQHFYDNVTRMAEHEATIKGMRERKENVAEYIRDNPESKLWQQANNAENQISAITKQKKAAIKRGESDEKLKKFDERKQAIMTRFNNQVKPYQE